MTVLVNGEAQTRSIQTGLSDDSYTEVTQGLSEGDIVLVSSTTRVSSATRVATATSTQQFPSGGNFTGMPDGGSNFTGMPGGGGFSGP